MLAVDTETTGVDLYHENMPYIVTVCDDNQINTLWEWDVDPETRMPIIPDEDLDEIEELFELEEEKVLHNSCFDVKALDNIGISWNWKGVHDTLPMSHLLSSNTPHDLTSLTTEYLGIAVAKFENRIKNATNQARAICKRNLPHWRIASEGDAMLPSIKSSGGKTERGVEEESFWKADMWLPKAIWKHHPELLPDEEPNDKGHSWSYLVGEYANSDTEATVLLFRELKRLLQDQSLWELYLERLKILPIVTKLQEAGMTIDMDRLEDLEDDYRTVVGEASSNMVRLAKGYGYDLEIPNGANNDSLNCFCFGYEPQFKSNGKNHCRVCGKNGPKTQRGRDGWYERIGVESGPLYCSLKCYKKRLPVDGLNLPVVVTSKKTGNPSLNKQAMQTYEYMFDEGTDEKEFIDNLAVKRKIGKSLEYIQTYKKFKTTKKRKGHQQHRLHPSLNPFGTDTLRWSSHNPSQQVISKQKDHNGRNLRYIFGPTKGRVWYSLDYDNLELRIPAYECGEPAMLELFEQPDKAPFYGSYHLLIVSILQEYLGRNGDKDRWKECVEEVGLEQAGERFKELYKSSWYQWTKNGNFAELYGAIDTGDGKGTADIAFHIPGAQSIIAERLTEKNNLNQYWINHANRLGYVETMVDETVDQRRGYPIRCKRSTWGKVVETTPLNYHVQGTACWVMMRAMIKIQELLDLWGPSFKMIANVHDEVVLDFPANFSRSGKDLNRPKVMAVKKVMEQRGRDIGVKLTVGAERHIHNWSESVAV